MFNAYNLQSLNSGQACCFSWTCFWLLLTKILWSFPEQRWNRRSHESSTWCDCALSRKNYFSSKSRWRKDHTSAQVSLLEMQGHSGWGKYINLLKMRNYFNLSLRYLLVSELLPFIFPNDTSPKGCSVCYFYLNLIMYFDFLVQIMYFDFSKIKIKKDYVFWNLISHVIE